MTTQTTTNEAAERLRAGMPHPLHSILDDALAAAKAEGAREAVERIRTAIERSHHSTIANVRSVESLHRILDEEAAR